MMLPTAGGCIARGGLQCSLTRVGRFHLPSESSLPNLISALKDIVEKEELLYFGIRAYAAAILAVIDI